MKKTQQTTTKPKTLTITLLNEKALDKNSKVIKTNGEVQYKQHDAGALMQLLVSFDSKAHTMKDYKNYLNVKDIVEDCWRKDAKELKLSLDQTVFLKDFLSNFHKKEIPTNLNAFLLRTLVSIVEQLE